MRDYAKGRVRKSLPSRSTVEKRLRDAIINYVLDGWIPDDEETLKRSAKDGDLYGLAARLELHLRATRKDAR